MTMVKVKLDSTGLAYDAAPEVAQEMDRLKAEVATAKAAADTASARADSLDAELTTTKASIDKIRQDSADAARARIELEAVAKTHGLTLKQDASDRAIREAVIKAVRGDGFNMDGKSDDYVAAAYDLAREEGDKRKKTVAESRRAMNQDASPNPTNKEDAEDKNVSASTARARYLASLRK